MSDPVLDVSAGIQAASGRHQDPLLQLDQLGVVQVVLKELALGPTSRDPGELGPERLTADLPGNLLVQAVSEPVVLRLLALTGGPVEEDVLDGLHSLYLLLLSSDYNLLQDKI